MIRFDGESGINYTIKRKEIMDLFSIGIIFLIGYIVGTIATLSIIGPYQKIKKEKTQTAPSTLKARYETLGRTREYEMLVHNLGETFVSKRCDEPEQFEYEYISDGCLKKVQITSRRYQLLQL
jgi:hypothetical protein